MDEYEASGVGEVGEDPAYYLERTDQAAKSGAPQAASPDGTGSVWDTDEAIENLKMERSIHGVESPDAQTRRMLCEAGPLAAASIIHVALHSPNDNTRLSASRYIIDFNNAIGGAGAEMWEQLVADVIGTAELFANK